MKYQFLLFFAGNTIYAQKQIQISMPTAEINQEINHNVIQLEVKK